MVVYGYARIKFMKGFNTDAKMMYEEASQVANDAVGSIRTVTSFCVMELYRRKCEGPMQTGMRHGLISSIGFGVSLCFCFVSTQAVSRRELYSRGMEKQQFSTFPSSLCCDHGSYQNISIKL